MPDAADPTTQGREISGIKELLSEHRYEDAFVRSNALTKSAPENAEGWWLLTLAAKRLKRWEEARQAVKKTIDLIPSDPAPWGEFGDILQALNQDNEARKAYERGIRIDPDYAYGHVGLMNLLEKLKDYDGVVFHGQQMERIGDVGSVLLDKIGLAFWFKSNFPTSLHYYKKSAARDKLAFRYSNLGLIYERPELAQYLDASDAYRRALAIEPNNERALEASPRLAKRLSTLTDAVSQNGTHVLQESEFYRFYINPFTLLGCDANLEIDDYPAKQIQKLKKRLVQEIELEDGRVDSLAGHVVDKSKALSLCDELLAADRKQFHWCVFQDKRLGDFLHTGDLSLFTYDENYFPAPTLDAIDDPAFLNWLSVPFSGQYDLVLSRALELDDLGRMGALLSGRRYIAQQDDELCFAGARRIIDRRMEHIRGAEQQVSTKLPSLSALSEMLIDPKNPQTLAPLLNLLPAAHFRSYQNEVVRLIRAIALSCNNDHSRPELASDVLQLANAFVFVSIDVKHQVETDEKQVKEIIAKEREHEVRLTQKDAPLEITKEGVRKGPAFIATKDLKAIRWGVNVTRSGSVPTYDFLLAVLSTKAAQIEITWSASRDTEENNEYFSKMIDASLSFAIPSIVEKIIADLDNDRKIVIGNCELARHEVTVLMPGWFSSKRHSIPWHRVHTEIMSGDLILSDQSNSRVRVTMPIRTTFNAVTLGVIAAARGKQQ